MARKNLPSLSIVIPAFNSRKYYRQCLGSLLKINYPNYEIIVIDDGSTDGSYELIREMSQKYKRLRIVKTLKKKGIPGSRNLGVEVSRGDFIAFLDMDMEVTKSWPGAMMEVLRKDKKVGGVLPKVLDFHRRGVYQCAGFWIIPQTGWVVPRGFGVKDLGQFDKVEQIGIGAAASVIRREVLERVGGFDERLGNFDDIDLGWRVALAGWKTLYVPDSVIYHWTAKPWTKRVKKISTIEHELYFDNLILMLVKNYEFGNLVWYLPQALGTMLFRIVINALRGNLVPFVGVLTTLVQVTYWLPGILKERQVVQGYRRVSDQKLFKTNFIAGNLLTIYTKHLMPLWALSRDWLSKDVE